MTNEIRPVPGFMNLFASDDGHLFLLNGDGILRRVNESHRADGYLLVNIKQGDKWRPYFVHRLVASAWHGAPSSSNVVTRHLDGNRQNNAASNLRFGSPAENAADTVKAGRSLKGAAHPNARLTPLDVHGIRCALSLKVPYSAIAAKWGVNKSTVADIARGRTWREEPGQSVNAA